MQTLVIGDPQMTFGGIWRKTKLLIFFQFLAFSSNKKIQTLVIGFWKHLEQNTILQMFAFLTQKLAAWTPKYAICCHGRPPIDIWGHLEQNNFLANVCIFYPQMGNFDPKYANFAHLGHARPDPAFGAHKNIVHITAFLTPKMGIFDKYP